MESNHSKAKVRRWVGLMDLLVTAALIIQIIIFNMIPLVEEKPASRYKYGLGSPNPHQDGLLNEKWWLWPFLGGCLTLASVPVLAALALIISTSPNMSCERTLCLTRLWMYCNSFTMVLIVVEILVVLLFHFLVIRVGVPFPSCAYVIIRAIFTVIIWKQLNTMSPTSSNTLGSNLIEEKRATYREVSKLPLPLHERHMHPEYLEPMPPPVLPLRPYRGRGGGLSMPNCQCCASQTA